MNKIILNLFYWIGLPGLFAASLSFDDPRLAMVGATLLWANGIILVPLSLIALAVMHGLKPGDPTWGTSKAAVLDDRPGVLKRAVSWTAMAVTVCLCAYTGFVVTAVFYLISYLFIWAIYFRMVQYFEKAEAE